jgi:hypothetical protein
MSGNGFFDDSHVTDAGLTGSAGPRTPTERFVDDYGVGIGVGLAVILFALLVVRTLRKYPHSDTALSNLPLICGAGLAAGTILLTDLSYGGGVIENILRGGEVLDSGLQARWPLLASLILCCWGLLRRFARSRAGGEE